MYFSRLKCLKLRGFTCHANARASLRAGRAQHDMHENSGVSGQPCACSSRTHVYIYFNCVICLKPQHVPCRANARTP